MMLRRVSLNRDPSSPTNRSIRWCLIPMMIGLAIVAVGCHDGPLYALKAVNPYYTMVEWKQDRELGVTDQQRHRELVKLVSTIEQQPADRQAYWLGELEKIFEYDESAEMRRLVVVAAGRLSQPEALTLIERGLDDSDLKVRMEACRSLGRRADESAARMLVATVHSADNKDVRDSAIAALGSCREPIAVDTLESVLQDPDPSTQRLVVQSLRTATGKDFGESPQAWIAGLQSDATAEDSPSGMKY